MVTPLWVLAVLAAELFDCAEAAAVEQVQHDPIAFDLTLCPGLMLASTAVFPSGRGLTVNSASGIGRWLELAAHDASIALANSGWSVTVTWVPS